MIQASNKHQDSEHTFSIQQPQGNFSSTEGQSTPDCLFCSCKPLIMQQLQVLKQAIQQKNEKIYELEQFIQRLSQMMLSEEDTFPFSATAENQPRPKKFLSSSGFHSKDSKTDPESSLSKVQIDSSMLQMGQARQFDRVSITSSDHVSCIKSQQNNQEQQMMRNSLKKQILKLNLDGCSQKSDKILASKEIKLRTKLVEIMNVLPLGGSVDNMEHFDSHSEPLSQGKPGPVQSKGSLKSNKSVFNRKIEIQEVMLGDNRSEKGTFSSKQSKYHD